MTATIVTVREEEEEKEREKVSDEWSVMSDHTQSSPSYRSVGAVLASQSTLSTPLIIKS